MVKEFRLEWLEKNIPCGKVEFLQILCIGFAEKKNSQVVFALSNVKYVELLVPLIGVFVSITIIKLENLGVGYAEDVTLRWEWLKIIRESY